MLVIFHATCLHWLSNAYRKRKFTENDIASLGGIPALARHCACINLNEALGKKASYYMWWISFMKQKGYFMKRMKTYST